ncbi:MAG: hypothetical protein ACR2NZ_22055 [Rubripirellula sp.]
MGLLCLPLNCDPPLISESMQDPVHNPYQAPSTASEPLDDAFQDKRLRTAATGLKLMYVGILLILLAFIMSFPASIFEIRPGIVLMLIAILGFGGLLLVNVGPLMCTTVPKGLGLRSFAIATVIAQFVSVTFALSQSLNPTFSAMLGIAAILFALAAATLFLVFISRTARHIQRTDLVKRTRNVFLIGAVVLCGLMPAFLLFDSREIQANAVITIVSIFAFALLFVAYANLVNAVGNAIVRPGVVKHDRRIV